MTGQFFLTTAEEEANLFWGDAEPLPPSMTWTVPPTEPPLAPGTYRVVMGMLFKIEKGLPPRYEEKACTCPIHGLGSLLP